MQAAIYDLIVKHAQNAQSKYTSLERFVRVLSTSNACYLNIQL